MASISVKKLYRWEQKHKLIPLFIVFCILTFLTIKLLFKANDANGLFYLYGITVTTVVCITFITTFTKYKDPYDIAIKNKERLNKMPNPLVSCLVAVHNEETIIEQCIKSLCEQTYQNKEIVIVDDCSTDKTYSILKRLAKKHPIKVIHLKQNVGKKKALAQGILASEGTIYAFSDSDSTWAPDALDKIVLIFKNNADIGAISGHVRAMNGDHNLLTKVQDSWYEGQFSIRKAFESVYGAVTCVSGPLAVFRKEAIYNFMPAWEADSFLKQEFRFATDRTLTGFVLGGKQIGPKIKRKYADNEFLKTDYELHDWKIVYCKSAKAWTHVPDTASRVLKQQIRWKKSFLRNIFFTGKFYWRKSFLPALIYYLHIAFVIFGPVIVFRHLVYLPLHGNFYSMFLYLAGICFVGFMFGLAYKLEEPSSTRWAYRPLMSLMSTLFLSWLVFYSLLTIRKMKWSRA